MHTYTRTVNYYETDKMGITHHSNYVRWMEEARMDYFNSIGYRMSKFEAEGVYSPVVSVNCRYRRTTTFEDVIQISVSPVEYSGVKLVMGYTMINLKTGETVFTGTSSHCFIGGNKKPLAIKNRFPDFDAAMRREVQA